MDTNYKVMTDKRDLDYYVNYKQGKCSCLKMQSKGFPCAHFMAVIR